MPDLMGLCPQWSSIGRGPLDGKEAFRFDCLGPYQAMGVTVSDSSVWLDVDYLGIKSVGTGTLLGTTATTTSTFSDWGAPVMIPDPRATG